MFTLVFLHGLSIFFNIDLGRMFAILSVVQAAAVVLIIRVFCVLLPSYQEAVGIVTP